MRPADLRERVLRRLERELRDWSPADCRPPPGGWLRAVRVALGLTPRRLAERAGVSRTAVLHAELAEGAGSVSLTTLARYADAMECNLYYALIPRAGSLRRTLQSRVELWYRARHPGEQWNAQDMDRWVRRFANMNPSSLWGGRMRP